MRNARSHTAIGAIGRLSDTIGAIGALQIVEERVTAAFHYRSYRRGHYRTIGEGTIRTIGAIGPYRSPIGVHYRTIGPELNEARGSEGADDERERTAPMRNIDFFFFLFKYDRDPIDTYCTAHNGSCVKQ